MWTVGDCCFRMVFALEERRASTECLWWLSCYAILSTCGVMEANSVYIMVFQHVTVHNASSLSLPGPKRQSQSMLWVTCWWVHFLYRTSCSVCSLLFYRLLPRAVPTCRAQFRLVTTEKASSKNLCTVMETHWKLISSCINMRLTFSTVKTEPLNTLYGRGFGSVKMENKPGKTQGRRVYSVHSLYVSQCDCRQ